MKKPEQENNPMKNHPSSPMKNHPSRLAEPGSTSVDRSVSSDDEGSDDASTTASTADENDPSVGVLLQKTENWIISDADRQLLDNVDNITEECNCLAKELETKKKTLLAAEAECKALHGQLAAAIKSAETQCAEKEMAQAECKKLRADLAASVEKAQKERAANDTAERELEEINDGLRQRNENLLDTVNSYRAAESRHTGEVHALSHALRVEEERSEGLAKEVEELREEKARLLRENEAYSSMLSANKKS